MMVMMVHYKDCTASEVDDDSGGGGDGGGGACSQQPPRWWALDTMFFKHCD